MCFICERQLGMIYEVMDEKGPTIMVAENRKFARSEFWKMPDRGF